jgi:hypothetical protein
MMSLETFAHDIEVANSDGVTIYYVWMNNNTELAVSYAGSSSDSYSNEYSGSVVIPESVTYNGNTYPVTSIGNSAFRNCSGLTSITIPNSVTSIGRLAFSGCTGLTGVNIPNSVTSIGRLAFSGCTGLTGVNIPNFVTSIDEYVFQNCSSLTSVFIPSSVTSIGDRAFSGCSSLMSLTIPSSVISIGEHAFSSCSCLMSVTIPKSVTSIGSNAFSYCTNLESVTIGAGVLNIGINVFSQHTPAKIFWLANTPPSGYMNAAGTMNYVANNLYTDLHNKTEYSFLSSMFEVGGVIYVPISPSERTCEAIDCRYDVAAENVHIGKTVTSRGITLTVKQILPYAFYRNPFVDDVDLSFDGNIGDYAFFGCVNMSNAVVKNVGKVGNYAFSGCTNMSNAEVKNTGDVGSYAFSDCTTLETATLGEEVTSLGNHSFENCSSLKEITIPNAMQAIGEHAFQNCSSMTKVKIGTGIKSIETYTFAGCSKLTNMQIGTNVTTINTYAFSSCTSLPKIRIPQAVTDIRNSVFYKCSCLQNVIIEDRKEILNLGSNSSATTSYGNPLFSSCPLDSVYIGGNISYNTSGSYGYSPFYQNTTLRSVVSKGDVGDHEFSGCTALESVTLGEEVTSLGTGSFSNCSSLKEITIPNAVRTIGQYAFSNCSAMTKVRMGTGVKSIETYTFSGCSKLEDMQIGSNVATINTYAFSGCITLPVINIPRSVTDIKNSVFYQCCGLKTVIIEDRETTLNFGSNKKNTNNYGNPLFSDCPLDSVYIGGDISYSTSSSYGYSPFYRNTSLRSVVITDKETEIPDNEFYGCTNLKKISIGDGVESIGDWAFSGCSSLEYFAFGSALGTIGKEAFSDCTAVTQIISHATTPPTCGTQALDDINKWDCTLRVPSGGVSTYYVADQWKDFFFVQEESEADLWFKLTYMVDGEEYEVYDKKYGTTITPEAEPEKEGYTFSGWGYIPEMMPARDITIVGFFTKNSDPIFDTDITQVDNVIYINNTEVKMGSELSLAINMKNVAQIRGFQFDLYLPEGVNTVTDSNGKIMASLTSDRLPEGDGHTLTVNKQTDGSIRFLCGSQNNDCFTGNDGEIATIRLAIAKNMAGEGSYPLILRNIKLTETNINNSYLTDGIIATLTVQNYIDGDLSGDGVIDVSDYIGVANYILGTPQTGITAEAADVNKDNLVDVSDYIGVANLILYNNIYGQTANASRRWQKRANTDVSALNNIVYITPFETTSNSETQVSVKMKNTVGIRGFQFDLYLPEGITAKKDGNNRIVCSLNNGRKPSGDQHTLTMSEQPDGAIRFLCGSQYDETFTGNDGEIATLTISVAADVEADNYPIYLRNMKLTETDINNYYTTDEIETSVTVTGPADGRVVLDETSTTAPESANGVDVRVKRTINANEWSTICLPFAMSATQVKAAFGDDVQLADFTSYDTVEDTGENVVGLTVNFNMVTAIEANHPYVIKVSNAISEFTADNVTIDPEEEPCVEYDNGLTGKKRVVWGSFTGTYVADCVVPYEGDDASLFLSGNKWWYATAQTKHMKGYRAYFWFTDLLPDVSASRIQMAFNDETANVVELKDGRMEELKSYYNLKGQRVEKPLKKGLYICNGKKVIIK